jgi:hypothetical protein
MRIPSGVVDQYIYFVAVDATDFATRETGLSSFTVYRSRDGGAAAAMTTPTINETDATNMPGVYELLVDEDMTIGAGNDSEEMVFHITHAGMAPVTRTIELYRPKITAGNTLDVTATGAAGIDWGNVENAATSVDLSATAINLCDTVTTNTDMRGTDSVATASALAVVDANVDAILIDTAEIGAAGAGLTAIPWNASWDAEVQSEVADGLTAYNAVATTDLPTNFGDLAITLTTGQVTVGTNNDKTGYSISGTLTTLDALDTAQDAQHATTQAATTAIETDTQDIQSRLPSALVSGRMDSNVSAIGNNATSATNLSASALGIVTGACEGTPSTTVIQTDLAETTDDHYIGRVVVFTSGAAAGQATDITDYTGSTGTITVTALTTAPSSSDTFVIV